MLIKKIIERIENNNPYISDEELKDDICARQPYGRWLKENKLSLADIARPRSKSKTPSTGEELLQKQSQSGEGLMKWNLMMDMMIFIFPC